MSKTPFKSIRCDECSAPVRVADRVWNKEIQNFEYKLAKHEHRNPTAYNRSLVPSIAGAQTEEQPKRNWMSGFRFRRGQ